MALHKGRSLLVPLSAKALALHSEAFLSLKLLLRMGQDVRATVVGPNESNILVTPERREVFFRSLAKSRMLLRQRIQ